MDSSPSKAAPLEIGRNLRIQKRIRLNIGCGRSPKPPEDGWINCDLYEGEHVDRVFDAQKHWPFDDGFADEVYSSHTLEHLADHFAFFRQAWRVLKPGGLLTVRVPYGWHSASWWDFTHLRPWLQESFATLQPGFTHFTRNLQHERLGFAFWVEQATLVFNRPWARLWRIRPLRPLVARAGNHLLNVYREVMMDARKTTEDDPRSSAFGGEIHPCVVPCAFAVWEHEYYGRAPDGLPYHRLMVFPTRARAATGDG